MGQSWLIYVGLIMVVWIGAILPFILKRGELVSLENPPV